MSIISVTVQNGINIYTVNNNGQHTVVAEDNGLYTILRGQANGAIEYIKGICVAV